LATGCWLLAVGRAIDACDLAFGFVMRLWNNDLPQLSGKNERAMAAGFWLH
jgi:hypothetical protein